MKAAFQKDEALLADIQSALQSRSHRLWWLGQSGFLIVQDGRAILFDPYLSDSLTRKYAGTDKPHVRVTERVIDPVALGGLGVIELVTSSHNHTDHLDAETLLPIFNSNPAAKLAFPEANKEFVRERLGAWVQEQSLSINAGVTVTWKDIKITGIPAAHNEVEKDSAGRCKFLGFVVQWRGVTFFHSGDTLFHPGLPQALRPFTIDVAFLPINGNRPERRVAGNLSGREAASLARQVGVKLVIPCHYDLFEFNTASPDDFVDECRHLGQSNQILRNGEALILRG